MTGLNATEATLPFFDSATPPLPTDRPRSASPSRESVTHQAGPLEVNPETTQRNTSYVDLDVTEMEVESVDIFAKGDDEDDNDDTRTMSRPRPPTVSPDISVSDSNEVVDGGSTDVSSDEDYDDTSNTAASEIGSRPRSRKRARRVKDMKHKDAETSSTHPLNISCQAVAAISSGGMKESEEIPIYGYSTLKTIGSKVVYHLTLSQGLLAEPSPSSHKQDNARNVSSSSDRRVLRIVTCARTGYEQTCQKCTILA
ncbi:hypothetical protein F5884DRAFT_864399 [Xylogone sp. PMI_703]|nr:hypothetical protein F5884DRAFT_864399 [Xylogone sp. PMI_703]